MDYIIKRAGTTVMTVKPTGPQSKKVMGENLVTMTVQLAAPADIQINDYVDVFVADKIERYFLLEETDIFKASSRDFTYTITFKGWQYLLKKAQYKFLDSNNEYTLTGVPLMGNLDTFIDLLIVNANRDQTGWAKGTIDTSDYQLITFNDNDSCLSVLATLATAFDVEWWVEGQTIHMTKRGVVEAVTFKYGQGNGLYDIRRTSVTDKNMVTRLYAYGGTQNLPPDYKGFSDKLKLPGTTPYLENNVYKDNNPAHGVLYGVIEDTVVFADIRPERLGLVTGVTDEFTFTDSAIDFDVNLQLLPGITAHLVFNTGQLAGYKFEIASFDNATKTFKINANQDDKSFIVPTTLIKAAVGDQYVIEDVKMPDSYITAAENEVMAKAQNYLATYSVPVVQYAVTCDPINFKQRGITLTLGNYVHIEDTDLGIDADMRIVGFTRDLQIPSKYTIELADSATLAPQVLAAVNNENLGKTVKRVARTTNTAYNNALQAKATADGVKLITDYWGVTIDPDHGIIAAGTLLVGAGSVGNAGITGVIDNVVSGVDKSVRIWAGAAYEDKDTAPFRVTDDGKMFARAGFIGNWGIDDIGLVNDSTNDVYLKTIKRDGSSNVIASAYVGTDGSGVESAIAVFIADETGSAGNQALYCRASNSTTNNTAASFDGDVIFANGDIHAGGFTGITGTYEYDRASTRFYFKIQNGIVVEQGVAP